MILLQVSYILQIIYLCYTSLYNYCSFFITGGGDYKHGPYTVAVPDNVTDFTFNIPIIDDDVMEPDEEFTVVIDSIDHPQVIIGRNDSVRVTIENDEDRK